MKKITILLGPKHSGKTSVAQVFAKRFNGKALDTDLIIQETGSKGGNHDCLSIDCRTLYKKSVTLFREAEAAALREVFRVAASESAPLFAATGGGLVDNAGALNILREEAGNILAVYLEVSASVAWGRIKRAAAKSGEMPAFLQGPNPKKTHSELHERRCAAYSTLIEEIGGLTIKCGKKTVDCIVRDCVRDCVRECAPAVEA
jgi:shikimate kinase